ncbi:MAG: hypothetical protein D6724_04610 [Armatimonadetes bacterium]|nr:MAG: hypothetical protein D6724_04610 [Armatimonadota bacterium]
MNVKGWALGACTLVLAGSASAQLRLETYVTGLSQPVHMVQDPTDPNVQFVVQQRGRIRIIQNGNLLGTDFLDLTGVVSQSGSERGLLGMAFDPDYANNRRFYVNFTNTSGNTVIARFKRMPNDPLKADPNSRFDFLFGSNRFIVQDFSNHNGGTLMFGPDGYLYIGMGDGGSGGDPNNRAQNPNSYLGKMLRIDVNVPDTDNVGYRIPSDNPFLDGDPINALGEIWAFGVRNPWKFSFDDWTKGGTGALVIADVGQNSWEEIDYEPAGRGGRNYGWSIREGAHPFNSGRSPAYTPLIDPIYEYSHSVGQSITGGYVYRGTMLGCDFFGRYFFGDFVSRKVFSIGLLIDPNTGEATATNPIEHTGDLGTVGNVSSFGVDANGELYIVDYSGTIRKVLPENAIWMTNVTAVDGGIVTGGLRDLLCVDGMRMRTFSDFTSEIDQANLTTLEVNLKTDITNLQEVDVSVTASIDQTVGGEIRIFFKNVNTGMWERVATFSTNTSEQTFQALNIPATNYRDSNGNIQMQVRSIVNLPITVATFFTQINQVKVTPS